MDCHHFFGFSDRNSARGKRLNPCPVTDCNTWANWACDLHDGEPELCNLSQEILNTCCIGPVKSAECQEN